MDGPESFEQQQFGTAGVEGVNFWRTLFVPRPATGLCFWAPLKDFCGTCRRESYGFVEMPLISFQGKLCRLLKQKFLLISCPVWRQTNGIKTLTEN